MEKVEVDRSPDRDGNRYRGDVPPRASGPERHQYGGPDQIEVFLDGERPEVSRVPPQVRRHHDVVAGEQHAAQPFARTHDDNAGYREQADYREICERGREDPERSTNIEGAKIYTAGPLILIEQPPADE